MRSEFEPDAIVHRSSPAFDVNDIVGAAIYCSDGRIGGAVDAFMRDALGLPCHDRLVIPGGPACLAERFQTWRTRQYAASQMEFLIEAHALRRIILIAHDDCAYYLRRLGVPAGRLREVQRADMRKTADALRSMNAELAVEMYFAGPHEGKLVFVRAPD